MYDVSKSSMYDITTVMVLAGFFESGFFGYFKFNPTQ